MVLTDTMITQWLSMFLLPFFRIAAFMAVAPVFSVGVIPVRVKLILSLALTLVIVPGIPAQASSGADQASLFFSIVNQIIVGISLGFVVQIIFSAIINGGQIIGMQMGLGFAQMMDPQTGVSVPVIAQFYNIMAILLFIAINGHLVMIGVLANSFEVVPVMGAGLMTEKYYSIAAFGGWVFTGGLMIALPAVTALLAINIILGVLTKAAPQMNIFAVGFVITILSGFVIILITLPIAFSQATVMFDKATEMMLEVLRNQ